MTHLLLTEPTKHCRTCLKQIPVSKFGTWTRRSGQVVHRVHCNPCHNGDAYAKRKALDADEEDKLTKETRLTDRSVYWITQPFANQQDNQA